MKKKRMINQNERFSREFHTKGRNKTFSHITKMTD